MVYPGLVVLGVGVAIGLLFVGAVFIAEQINQPNQPYSQRRNPPRQSSYRPSQPPSPSRRRHCATSTDRTETADRATSPIGNSRHFADECSVCHDDRRAVVSFQPCGDYVMCRQCAEEYISLEGRNCPQCHRRIQSID